MLLARRAAAVILAAFAVAACDRTPTGASSRGCDGRPIGLDPGEVIALEPGDGVCDLGRAPGAEYALVYLDTRIVDALDGEPEPYWKLDETYTVTLADEGGGAALREGISVGVSRSEAPPDRVMEPAGPAPRATWHDRTLPWVVGDTVWTPACAPDAPCTGQQLADVARVYDGWLAVAVRRGDPNPAHALARLDAAYPLVRQHGLALLAETFGATRPLTSAGAGQFMMVVGTTAAGAARKTSLSWTRLVNDSVRGWVELWLAEDLDLAPATSLLAHELAHQYQRLWSHASRSPGVPGSPMGVTRWGVEGGANLMSYEVIRRIANAPLAGNFDWRNPGPDPFAAYYALRAQSAAGAFTSGYDGTMPFLRDLVVRRVQAGEPLGAALREVSRGAVEGWSGRDGLGSARPGLAGRMRAALGPRWEPGDALLTWALSVVGDDRNPSTLYQDPVSLRTWDVRPGEYGWHPDGVLEGGSGATVTGVCAYGSPGYSYLRDVGAGVRVRLSSSVPREGMRWMVMRIR
ncbi:MAG TPA: hypothetical protein VHG08_05340 [Longimicrobium sp.]|nr:hypothetical protein [Longimicrobium sp.]